MATTLSTESPWESLRTSLRIELAEIMDDLDPGWAVWRASTGRLGERSRIGDLSPAS